MNARDGKDMDRIHKTLDKLEAAKKDLRKYQDMEATMLVQNIGYNVASLRRILKYQVRHVICMRGVKFV